MFADSPRRAVDELGSETLVALLLCVPLVACGFMIYVLIQLWREKYRTAYRIGDCGTFAAKLRTLVSHEANGGRLRSKVNR